MSKAEVNVGHIREYDPELGQITKQDHDYAADLITDFCEAKSIEEGAYAVAEWLRKVRYEAVIADRKKRGDHIKRGDGK